MGDAKSQLYNYLDKLLKDYPIINISNVKSLSLLRSELSIGKLKLINWVNEYLIQNFGLKKAQSIKGKLWPYSSTVINQIKKEKLFKILDSQFKNYFPDNINKISSLTKLKSIVGTRRSTITDWVLQYLSKKYGSLRGNLIFNNIWTIRQQSKHIAITHKYLKKFLKNRDAKLITTEIKFNNMKELPTSRYIEIECENGHKFNVQVLHLLYHNLWCPSCNIRFCQKIMRLYMEAIFNAKFPETTLKTAYGIHGNKGGRLTFDGFNSYVNVKGKEFKIAFEYDGLQHDIYPNPFHRSYKKFKKQKENDRKKIKLAHKFNTYIIRLKEIDGFNSESINHFQKEIINQFQKATGIRLENVQNLFYDPYNDSLIRIKSLDQFITNNQKDPNKKAEHSSSNSNSYQNNSERKKDKKVKFQKYKLKPHPYDVNRENFDFEGIEDEFLWLSGKVREVINVI